MTQLVCPKRCLLSDYKASRTRKEYPSQRWPWHIEFRKDDLIFGFKTSNTLTYLLYLLTPCSRVLLEKLTGSQLVKKFPAFYGTRRFITVLTSARHLTLFLDSVRTAQ